MRRNEVQTHGRPTADAESCEGGAHGRALVSRYADSAVEKAVRLFRTLGDGERLELLGLLAGGEACVSDLAESSGAELSTVSQRLRFLRAEGLVSRRRDGKHIYYGLADQHIATLIQNALEHTSESETQSEPHAAPPNGARSRKKP